MIKMNNYQFIKEFLKKIEQKNIFLKDHFKYRLQERPISEDLVRKYIKRIDRLLFVEKQESKSVMEHKYKLSFRLSSKYNLVLIVSIQEKCLYIITGWNSDRKWKKKNQK